jgi:hypothetical protein
MKSTAFLIEVKRRATRLCSSNDPLAEARRLLQTSGLTAEGQMLRKVVDALGADQGEFGESDVHRLGADMLALVSALADARATRRYSDADWLKAAAEGR